MNKAPKIILGVDPGTLHMGYGVIEVVNSQMRFIAMDVLRMKTVKDSHQKLFLIHKNMVEIIGRHKPAAFAIEAPFYGKNVQSMLKLGRAQGVAIAAAMQLGLEVSEYSPKKVKQSITGNGNADKQQVWKMLKTLLNIQQEPDSYDATDALSIAVCHFFQQSAVSIDGKKLSGWKDFLNKNPERVK